MSLYRAAHGATAIVIIDFDETLRDAAVLLYEDRADKAWSIVDCLSFLLMRGRGLSQSLTRDHHFEQAGFTALLLTEPGIWYGICEQCNHFGDGCNQNGCSDQRGRYH